MFYKTVFLQTNILIKKPFLKFSAPIKKLIENLKLLRPHTNAIICEQLSVTP